MSPARRQRIDGLYHSALDVAPERRSAFLSAACGEDVSLCEEVHKLLDASVSSLATQTLQGTAALGPESSLGPYRIEALLGAGGMGEVFRATDTRLGRTIALKILSRRQLVDPVRKQRFLMEARAVSALNHPNIVTLYDISTDGEIDYLVMEYVPGVPLDKLIRPGGLPAADTASYALQLCEALATAHAAGIVHRDIKPANVVIASGGQVKVLDFGLAKPEELQPGERNLTETGMAIGTPSYMSPEQARGQKVDARSDLFSLGALIYEMATGQRAFTRVFDWKTPACDSLPGVLKPVVLKLLETDRELRYQSAAAVARDLRLAQLAPKPGPKPKRLTLVVSGAATAAVAIAAYFLLMHPAGAAAKLTDTDTIVLADFDNRTGDPVFDDTLRTALSIELQQSAFVSLVPDRQVRQTLALMGPVAGGRLTAQVAQQVCERVGSAAVLQGSLVRLGSEYVLGLHAKRCASGSDLFQEQTPVASKEAVLTALSTLARKFRAKAGEALSQVKEHSTPLPEATTVSLDALKAYATGMKITATAGNLTEAIASFRRAVELDPDFAMAWANLGLGFHNLSEPVLAMESTTKAWRLRSHASDAERFFIDFTYDRQVTGNLERAYRTLESWAHSYPRSAQPRPQGLLGGLAARGTGRFEQCVDYQRKEIEADPKDVYGYESLAVCEMYRNRFPQAQAALDLEDARKMQTQDGPGLRFALSFLQGRQPEMDRVVAASQGQPGTGHLIMYAQAFILAHGGRLKLARVKAREAEELAQREGEPGPAADYRASIALQEALYEKAADAKADATAALAQTHARDVEYAAGFALARTGDRGISEKLAADLEKRFPEDTFAHFTYVPELRALNALARHQPAEALELLQTCPPYELAVNGLSFYLYLGGMHSTYLRGEAYLALKKPADAAAEFRRILAHPGLVYADPVGVLAHLQLARALALSGDPAHAKAEYEQFFAMWKDADPGLQALIEARAEYSRLH